MKKRLFVLVYMLSFPLMARELTMQEYISYLQNNDIEMERVMLDLQRTEFAKDLMMPTRQYLLAIQNEYGIVLGDGETTSQLAANASRNFSETGTQASIFYAKNKLIGRDEETTGIRVEQSLLRNAFGKQTRMQSEALDLENQILFLQVLQAYEDYMERKMQEYLDLQLDYLNYQTSKEFLEETSNLEKNIEQRKKSNIALSVDVDRIRMQTLIRRETELQARNNFEQRLQAVKVVISKQEPMDLNLEVKEEKIEFAVADEDIAKLLENSRTLEVLSLQERALNERVRFQKRNNSPELGLVLGANRDEFTRFNVSADRNEAVLGFNFELPLGDSLNKAMVKDLSLQASTAKMDYELNKRNLELQLKNLLHNIRQQSEALAIAEEKSVISGRLVAEETKRYERGQIRLDQLIEVRNLMVQSRFDAISGKVGLGKLIISWKNLTDQLVEKNENFGQSFQN